MTTKFVVVQNSPDGTSMPVDTAEQVEAARLALAECGQYAADVYYGDPECPDAYASGQRIFSAEASNG